GFATIVTAAPRRGGPKGVGVLDGQAGAPPYSGANVAAASQPASPLVVAHSLTEWARSLLSFPTFRSFSSTEPISGRPGDGFFVVRTIWTWEQLFETAIRYLGRSGYPGVGVHEARRLRAPLSAGERRGRRTARTL